MFLKVDSFDYLSKQELNCFNDLGTVQNFFTKVKQIYRSFLEMSLRFFFAHIFELRCNMYQKERENVIEN